MTAPCVLWLLHDGKPGHRSQLDGLRAALAARVDVDAHWLAALPPARAMWDWLRGRTALGHALPAPHFIVVAGHRTHWSGLAVRRARGGRLVALMRPSLPAGCFDAIIAPQHDRGTERANVLRTAGVLNPMQPGRKTPGSALALLGGHSRHFGWDDAALLATLERLQAAWPQLVVADSRRTPATLRAALAQRFGAAYQAWERCPPGWLATTLASTETAWITADSVSMVYEALSAGCATGLITLPPADRPGKLAHSVAQLIARGQVRDVADWQHHGGPLVAGPPLAEAARAAAWLLARFPCAAADAS